MKVLRVALAIYIGLSIVLALLQTSLIFPGAASQGRADAVVGPSEGSEIAELKAKTGETITAMFGAALTPNGRPHPEPRTRATLVYFYGNGMCMADTAGEFSAFRRRGFNVIVADYLGYGMSGGKPSEAGCYATADACYDYLLTRPEVDPARIVPMGWSLGSGSAVHLASTRPVRALVLVSAFTSIADMAKRAFPLIPAKAFLRHRFENETKLRAVRVPVFLAHGTRDGIIPFDMSKKLAAAAGGPVTKYDVIDGDHNDVYDVGGTGLLDAIQAFVEKEN